VGRSAEYAGFGKNIRSQQQPVDALEALVDGKWTSCAFRTDELLRQGMDDASMMRMRAGGKGLFSTYSERAPTHIEGGKGQTSKSCTSIVPIVGELVGLYFRRKAVRMRDPPFLWL